MATAPGFSGILLRALAALVLVFATYNPEGYSYFHWAIAPLSSGVQTAGPASVKFLAGLALLAGWAVFLNATRRSIGLGGAVIVLAISGGLVWLLLDFGVVSASSGRGLTHVVLFCTAMLLAVGMSWSHLSRRLSGQVDMDPTD
jgi:hypothetical protein